jgi:hypothetical protein
MEGFSNRRFYLHPGNQIYSMWKFQSMDFDADGNTVTKIAGGTN